MLLPQVPPEPPPEPDEELTFDVEDLLEDIDESVDSQGHRYTDDADDGFFDVVEEPFDF